MTYEQAIGFVGLIQLDKGPVSAPPFSRALSPIFHQPRWFCRPQYTASQDRSDGRAVVTESGTSEGEQRPPNHALQTDGGALLTSRGLSCMVASMKMKCTIKAPPLSLVVMRKIGPGEHLSYASSCANQS